MSINDALNAVRIRNGQDPLPDPTVIQEVPGETYVNPPDVDIEGYPDPFGVNAAPPSEPPSPLIPRRPDITTKAVPYEGDPMTAFAPGQPAGMLTKVPNIPIFQMAIGDRNASWKGRDVQLTEAEEKKVRAVVLGALQRELDADRREVTPRRQRKPKTKPEAPGEAPAKPRRKRGSLLGPKV